MVRKDGAAIRRERLQEIARAIHRGLAKHAELPLARTVATFQYEYGLTKPKILEYLGILEGLGHFFMDHENCKIIKPFEVEKEKTLQNE